MSIFQGQIYKLFFSMAIMLWLPISDHIPCSLTCIFFLSEDGKVNLEEFIGNLINSGSSPLPESKNFQLNIDNKRVVDLLGKSQLGF